MSYSKIFFKKVNEFLTSFLVLSGYGKGIIQEAFIYNQNNSISKDCKYRVLGMRVTRVWMCRWGVLAGGNNTSNMKFQLWNLFFLVLLRKSFFKELVSAKKIVFKNIDQPNTPWEVTRNRSPYESIQYK